MVLTVSCAGGPAAYLLEALPDPALRGALWAGIRAAVAASVAAAQPKLFPASPGRGRGGDWLWACLQSFRWDPPITPKVHPAPSPPSGGWVSD